jgi:hypothetical protein
VLVWVASFPRSGNTFLRIVLHRRYGVRTSVVYDVDGVAARLGPELVGYRERTASIAEMRASDEVYFVKTHRRRDGDVDDGDRAICLVRDGRDALVSWARLRAEETGRPFAVELAALIARRDEPGTGGWGGNVLSWLRPSAPHRAVLRYEDLTRAAATSIDEIMAALLPDVRPRTGLAIPSFAELHRVDSGFFRRGHRGTHRDELPDDLHRLFWSHPDNAAAMKVLGDLAGSGVGWEVVGGQPGGGSAGGGPGEPGVLDDLG